MTVTPSALKRARQIRVRLDATVDQATRDLVQAWSGAWEGIADEWQAAVDDLASAGAWPARSKVLRAQRAQQALKVTGEALDELAKTSGVRILRDVSALTADANSLEQAVVAGQLAGGIDVAWSQTNKDALAAIVRRVTGQVEAATMRLPAAQQAVMKQALIRGVALGDNPRDAARIMMRRLEGGFQGGRHRAETIATTEILDAYRAAALAARKANADILEGWQWLATLDRRTCPGCLSMNGRTFPVDAPGPEGHQRCRCTSVPVTRSLRSLGFDIDDPPSEMPDARAWFDEQPAADQRHIMGAERLRQLRSGALSWDDLAMRRETPGWRPSIVVRPLAA